MKVPKYFFGERYLDGKKLDFLFELPFEYGGNVTIS